MGNATWDGIQLQEALMSSFNPSSCRVSTSFGTGTSAAVTTAINLAAIQEDDNIVGTFHDPSLFGPDTEDTSPAVIRGDFITLFGGSSMLCNKRYGKKVKIKIFYNALPLKTRYF